MRPAPTSRPPRTSRVAVECGLRGVSRTTPRLTPTAPARPSGCTSVADLTGMETRAGQVVVHSVEHGTGRPVLVLHGAGVDHREAEACFEPALEGAAGLRRIYPDLPGMGRTTAPETLRSADDVLDTLLDFADEVIGGGWPPPPPSPAGGPPAAAGGPAG